MRNAESRSLKADAEALAVLLTDAKKRNAKTAPSQFQSVLKHWPCISRISE